MTRRAARIDGPDPTDLPEAAAEPPARRAGRRPALGPARHAAARRPRAVRRSRTPPGRSCCVFVVAAVIALILNPLVAFAAARAPAARARRHRRLPRRSSPRSPASASCWPSPVADQARRSRDDVPGLVDDANALARRPAGLLRRQGHRRRRSSARATPRSQTLQEQVVGGIGRDRRRSAASSCRRLVELSFDSILVLVLSIYMLIYGRRIGAARARGHAARRRHARGRLPDARPARGRRLRARAAPVQPRSWARAPGVGAVDLRRARDLPRRQDLRLRVRRVLRAHGARPVRRARASARCRRSSSRSFAGPADRPLGRRSVPRAAAARGPRRRAERLRPTAAHQPAARHLRAAARRRDLRLRRRARRAAARGDRCARPSSTSGATSSSSRGAPAPLIVGPAARPPAAGRRAARARSARTPRDGPARRV